MQQRIRPSSGTSLRVAVIPQVLGLVLLVVAFVVSLALGGRGTVSLYVSGLAVLSLVAGLYVMWGRPWVLMLSDQGYRVRFIRGAGVMSGSWTDVSEVVTAVLDDTRCLVVRLNGGGQTVIPVGLLEADPDDLVRTLRDRLIEIHRGPRN